MYLLMFAPLLCIIHITCIHTYIHIMHAQTMYLMYAYLCSHIRTPGWTPQGGTIVICSPYSVLSIDCPEIVRHARLLNHWGLCASHKHSYKMWNASREHIGQRNFIETFTGDIFKKDLPLLHWNFITSMFWHSIPHIPWSDCFRKLIDLGFYNDATCYCFVGKLWWTPRERLTC